jgi:hypothetical protein
VRRPEFDLFKTVQHRREAVSFALRFETSLQAVEHKDLRIGEERAQCSPFLDLGDEEAAGANLC